MCESLALTVNFPSARALVLCVAVPTCVGRAQKSSPDNERVGGGRRAARTGGGGYGVGGGPSGTVKRYTTECWSALRILKRFCCASVSLSAAHQWPTTRIIYIHPVSASPPRGSGCSAEQGSCGDHSARMGMGWPSPGPARIVLGADFSPLSSRRSPQAALKFSYHSDSVTRDCNGVLRVD